MAMIIKNINVKEDVFTDDLLQAMLDCYSRINAVSEGLDVALECTPDTGNPAEAISLAACTCMAKHCEDIVFRMIDSVVDIEFENNDEKEILK